MITTPRLRACPHHIYRGMISPHADVSGQADPKRPRDGSPCSTGGHRRPQMEATRRVEGRECQLINALCPENGRWTEKARTRYIGRPNAGKLSTSIARRGRDDTYQAELGTAAAAGHGTAARCRAVARSPVHGRSSCRASGAGSRRMYVIIIIIIAGYAHRSGRRARTRTRRAPRPPPPSPRARGGGPVA